jgi:hypothetical protein
MSVWPEADATLRERWAAGVPCPQIARELGVSADSVIGRAHRIGLPRHPSVAYYNLPPPKPRNRSHRRCADDNFWCIRKLHALALRVTGGSPLT